MSARIKTEKLSKDTLHLGKLFKAGSWKAFFLRSPELLWGMGVTEEEAQEDLLKKIPAEGTRA